MGQDKRHPKTVYKAKYPYNRIEITESGHEIHYDDSPGHTRIRESHRSGTYREISHDGKQVTMTVGNRVDYSKQGKTTTVDKNHDEKIGGSSRVSIGGGSHTEVKGNHTTAVDGDHKTMVGGDSVSAVKGDQVHGVVGNTVFKMGGSLEIKGDSTKQMKVDGAANLEFGSTLDIFSRDKYFMHSLNDITIESVTNIVLKVGGTSLVLTQSGMYLVTSDMNIKGNSTVRIGGGQSVQVVSDGNFARPLNSGDGDDWATGGDPPDDPPTQGSAGQNENPT